MESSVGSPNTWRGACLARPGVTFNDEEERTSLAGCAIVSNGNTGEKCYDYCLDGNTLRIFYLDGVLSNPDLTKKEDFDCPTGYACADNTGYNDFCRYECTTNTDCWPAADPNILDTTKYYCTSGHCCPQTYKWNPAANNGNGACEAAGNCLSCTYNVYYGSSFNPWSIEPPYRADSKCNKPSTKEACCVADNYGFINFKDWYGITVYSLIPHQ